MMEKIVIRKGNPNKFLTEVRRTGKPFSSVPSNNPEIDNYGILDTARL